MLIIRRSYFLHRPYIETQRKITTRIDTSYLTEVDKVNNKLEEMDVKMDKYDSDSLLLPNQKRTVIL